MVVRWLGNEKAVEKSLAGFKARRGGEVEGFAGCLEIGDAGEEHGSVAGFGDPTDDAGLVEIREGALDKLKASARLP